MAETKITDLVSQETIDKIKELSREILDAKQSYIDAAKEMAKGLEIQVKVSGDLDRLESVLIEKTKQAAEAQQRMTTAIEQQRAIIGQTTPVIARHLMEQERVNKLSRQTYDEYDRVNNLLEKFHDTYEAQLETMVRYENALKANKKAQEDNKKALAANTITAAEYNQKQMELVAQHRKLTAEKRQLNQIMTAEEKAMLSTETSYDEMSQKLELLKRAYKQLAVEAKESDFGKELEETIQNLDMHLKETAADMGEFQRNVGNYAIAGQNGVVATESIVAVMNQQAITMQDVADQTKILEDAKRMLDTTDEHYAETLADINAKIEENKTRLLDVSDIMEKDATSVAEAESQNKRLAEAIKNVDLTSEDAQERIAELNAKIDENNKVIESGSESKSSIKKDLKELVLEIANLSIEYQNLSAEEKASADGQALASHIQELIERAGELKDAIADTNQAISNAASDTRGFDQLAGGLQLAIDGFGLAEGAAHLLGISSEELTEIQTKLQAAIAASNAMQSIQNTLQAQSALMQGVSLAQTRLRTIAENLHTAAQGKGVIATYALTAAQWAFNAAASANPIGLVVVAIIACIAVVWGLVKAFQAFFGTSEEALKQYDKQKKAIDDLCDRHDKQIDRMKALGATDAELNNQMLQNLEERKRATDALFERASQLYDEDEDEYKEALAAKEKADADFEQSKEDSLNYLYKIIHESEEAEKKERLGTYEYKRQLILAELEQQKALAATLLAQERITRQTYENLCASLEKAAQLKVDTVNKEEVEAAEKAASKSRPSSGSRGSSRADDAKTQAEELKKAVEAGEDALLKLIEDSLERQRQAEILSYNRQLAKLKDQLAKTKETQVSLRTALNRQIEALAVEHERKIAEITMARNERFNQAEASLIESHLSIVKEGTEEEYQWRLKELQNQEHAELLQIAKSENEKTVTVEQAEIMRTNLALKYAQKREDLENEYAEKRVEEIEKEYTNAQSARDNAMIEELNALKVQYAEKLKAAKGNASKLEEIQKDFQRNSREIQNKYAMESAEAAVQIFEDALKLENLSVEEREDLERKLAKAKIDLATLVAEQEKEAAEETTNNYQDEIDKRLAAIEKWKQVACDALNAINDLSSAVFDGQIERIDAEQEANSEAADKQQERISELVDKKVITEEEGEARKRAAEAVTAKKEEELEKKKAQLKHKQAVWDKANSLAQTAINTAAALMKLWVQPGWPAAVPTMAIVGAMGALQMATILATPIPKYAKGTDYHNGGPAIVGDGGRPEMVLFGDTAWVTPDTPTLVDLPQGASVLPSVLPIIDEKAYNNPQHSQIIINNDYKRLESKMDGMSDQIRRLSIVMRESFREQAYNHFKNSRF